MYRTLKFLQSSTDHFGLADGGIVVLGTLVAALFYRGSEGETYSLLNHFISELGEVGVSPLAWLFNLGLIIGGMLLIPFSLGLGLSIPGWLAKAGMIAGLVAAISLAGVGVFPMNNLPPHITTAMTYFRSGLATVVLFGLAILFQPEGQVVISRWANFASLLAAACYLSFIVLGGTSSVTQGTDALDLGFRTARPAVWSLAVMEWAVFFSTILWFAVIALGMKKAGQQSAGLQPVDYAPRQQG